MNLILTIGSLAKLVLFIKIQNTAFGADGDGSSLAKLV